jgi:hypothetical protein
VTAYRQSACLFCDAPSVEQCPRCLAAICAHHGGGSVARTTPDSWCTVCAKELKDDLDVARFAVEVNDVPPDSGALFQSRRAGGLAQLLDSAVGSLRTYFSERRVRKTFAARTPEQIAAWRRTAGVKARA